MAQRLHLIAVHDNIKTGFGEHVRMGKSGSGECEKRCNRARRLTANCQHAPPPHRFADAALSRMKRAKLGPGGASGHAPRTAPERSVWPGSQTYGPSPASLRPFSFIQRAYPGRKVPAVRIDRIDACPIGQIVVEEGDEAPYPDVRLGDEVWDDGKTQPGHGCGAHGKRAVRLDRAGHRNVDRRPVPFTE